MELTRRAALKSLGAGAVGVAATSLVSIQAVAEESSEGKAPKHAVGLLYDTTRCVGCQSCVAACNEVNNLEGDLRADRIHHSAQDLNSFAKNIIKLYRPTDGRA